MAAQQAAITSAPTYATPGGTSTPVVAFTVTMRGDYPVRLGDVQRSATRVLTTVLHPAAFAELAQQRGRGIRVGAYDDTAGSRRTVMTGWLSSIIAG